MARFAGGERLRSRVGHELARHEEVVVADHGVQRRADPAAAEGRQGLGEQARVAGRVDIGPVEERVGIGLELGTAGPRATAAGLDEPAAQHR